MKQKRFAEAQIVRILKELEAGACQSHLQIIDKASPATKSI
jgi:hypothetical protein